MRCLNYKRKLSIASCNSRRKYKIWWTKEANCCKIIRRFTASDKTTADYTKPMPNKING